MQISTCPDSHYKIVVGGGCVGGECGTKELPDYLDLNPGLPGSKMCSLSTVLQLILVIEIQYLPINVTKIYLKLIKASVFKNNSNFST